MVNLATASAWRSASWCSSPRNVFLKLRFKVSHSICVMASPPFSYTCLAAVPYRKWHCVPGGSGLCFGFASFFTERSWRIEVARKEDAAVVEVMVE